MDHFVYTLSDGSLIDGAEGGNATRHINHSCMPNCVAYEVPGADDLLRIEIEALKAIAAGAELVLDYSLNVEQALSKDYPCHCGAPLCRGTLIATEA